MKSKNHLQDLTRLYEIILQNLQEMQTLPGLEDDAAYQKEVEAKMTTYKAFRSVSSTLTFFKISENCD